MSQGCAEVLASLRQLVDSFDRDITEGPAEKILEEASANEFRMLQWRLLDHSVIVIHASSGFRRISSMTRL